MCVKRHSNVFAHALLMYRLGHYNVWADTLLCLFVYIVMRFLWAMLLG